MNWQESARNAECLATSGHIGKENPKMDDPGFESLRGTEWRQC